MTLLTLTTMKDKEETFDLIGIELNTLMINRLYCKKMSIAHSLCTIDLYHEWNNHV